MFIFVSFRNIYIKLFFMIISLAYYELTDYNVLVIELIMICRNSMVKMETNHSTCMTSLFLVPGTFCLSVLPILYLHSKCNTPLSNSPQECITGAIPFRVVGRGQQGAPPGWVWSPQIRPTLCLEGGLLSHSVVAPTPLSTYHQSVNSQHAV